MRQTLATALGIAPEAVDFSQSPGQMGLDSMLAVDIGSMLSDFLGKELSPTLLYRYDTVEALIQALASGLAFSPPPPAP